MFRDEFEEQKTSGYLIFGTLPAQDCFFDVVTVNNA